MPAAHATYELAEGELAPLTRPTRVFGVGLSYAEHIAETGAPFVPGEAPPVFEKRWSETRPRVLSPTADELLAAAEALEPGLADELRARGVSLDPLLDYEVELGLVTLAEVDGKRLGDPQYAPPLGFFVANDLSARALALLGEREATYRFWGASKSFAGFSPAMSRAWIPRAHRRDGLPRVRLETRVNGELRQQQWAHDMVYTTSEFLRFIQDFAGEPVRAGTWILTGTPGGVAIRTPRWKIRLASLLGVGRFRKLSIKLRERAKFLQPGDEVICSGSGLGSITTEIVSAST